MYQSDIMYYVYYVYYVSQRGGNMGFDSQGQMNFILIVGMSKGKEDSVKTLVSRGAGKSRVDSIFSYHDF